MLLREGKTPAKYSLLPINRRVDRALELDNIRVFKSVLLRELDGVGEATTYRRVYV
jgi:hypothetical protein